MAAQALPFDAARRGAWLGVDGLVAASLCAPNADDPSLPCVSEPLLRLSAGGSDILSVPAGLGGRSYSAETGPYQRRAALVPTLFGNSVEAQA